MVAAAAAAASAASASGASLVLKLVLDHLGLGATAGAHNPLDILALAYEAARMVCNCYVIGMRLHFGVYFHHCALALECSCHIHAVLEIE